MDSKISTYETFRTFLNCVEFCTACFLVYCELTSAPDSRIISGFIILVFSLIIDVKLLCLIINEKLR